jgi:hypothetical protein
MDSRYKRKIYRIVRKCRQIVYKLTNLQMEEQTVEKTVACTRGSALLVDVYCI